MLLGGASSTSVSRPTHVPSQKMARRLVGLAEVVDGMAMRCSSFNSLGNSKSLSMADDLAIKRVEDVDICDFIYKVEVLFSRALACFSAFAA